MIQRGVDNANRIARFYEEALREFNEAAARYDWPAAEAARARVVDVFDGYLNELGALYKYLQSLDTGDRR